MARCQAPAAQIPQLPNGWPGAQPLPNVAPNGAQTAPQANFANPYVQQQTPPFGSAPYQVPGGLPNLPSLSNPQQASDPFENFVRIFESAANGMFGMCANGLTAFPRILNMIANGGQ